MGRTYAGILGPLAFTTVVTRGLIEGGGVEPTMKTACLCLFAFAAIGYAIGRIAANILRDSVRAKFEAEMAAWETANSTEISGRRS